MAHLHFKPEIDFHCATELFNIVRGGQLAERRTEALDHAFFLGGTLNAWLNKGDHDHEGFQAVPVPNELEGDGGLLERLDAELGKAAPAGGEGHIAEGKMSEVLAALLKKFIALVLEQLL